MSGINNYVRKRNLKNPNFETLVENKYENLPDSSFL